MHKDKEIEEDLNPFKLAEHMGVSLKFDPALGEILGIYQPIQKNRFYINSSLHIEKQEDVCFQLVTHLAMHSDQALWITKDNFTPKTYKVRFMNRITNFMRINNFIVTVINTIKSWKQKSSLA